MAEVIEIIMNSSGDARKFEVKEMIGPSEDSENPCPHFYIYIYKMQCPMRRIQKKRMSREMKNRVPIIRKPISSTFQVIKMVK